MLLLPALTLRYIPPEASAMSESTSQEMGTAAADSASIQISSEGTTTSGADRYSLISSTNTMPEPPIAPVLLKPMLSVETLLRLTPEAARSIFHCFHLKSALC